jgi:hypothetical protein
MSRPDPTSLKWAFIATYVDRTIVWLDENAPGWRAKINGEVFEDADLRYCVLGQLYGNWWSAPLAVRTLWPFGLGDSDQPTVEAVWRVRLGLCRASGRNCDAIRPCSVVPALTTTR